MKFKDIKVGMKLLSKHDGIIYTVSKYLREDEDYYESFELENITHGDSFITKRNIYGFKENLSENFEEYKEQK